MLTNREQATYELIVANSELGRVTTQREIYENYPFDEEFRKDGYRWNEKPNIHDHCSAVWQDINHINAERNCKPIIYENYDYFVPVDYEQLKTFVKEKYWGKAMASLWRYANLLRKGKRDGSTNIFDEEDEENIFEAYIERAVKDLLE